MHPFHRTLLAWCAHLYTALGLVAAGGIAISILGGTPASFRFAFLLMLIATLIDATDGTFARWVQVKEVLPHFDGRRLDDLIDFHAYTTLPLLLIWRAQLIPSDLEAVLLIPLLASAYGFCQTAAKTDDGYFLGFPSYWNIIAFYLYFLQLAPWLNLLVIVFFAVLTFLPARYLYPTHRGRLNRLTSVLGAVWAVQLLAILMRAANEAGADLEGLLWFSLLFPAYYLILSWVITARIVGRARKQHCQGEPGASATGGTR